MFCFVGLCFGMLVRLFRERRSLLLENLALRQQIVALKRRHPRPCLGVFDKFFWVNRSASLLGLEAVPPHRDARNRRPLAPDRFLYVLATDLQSPEAGRKETDAEGGSGIDLPHGR
jgi:hypothetical protein